MYYLSSRPAQAETVGLYVRVTVWGYFIPASFPPQVCHVEQPYLSLRPYAAPVCLTNGPSRGNITLRRDEQKVHRQKLRRLYIYIVALVGFPDTKLPANVSIRVSLQTSPSFVVRSG